MVKLMSLQTFDFPQIKNHQEQIEHFADELTDLVRSRHKQSYFRGPRYYSDDHLWVIEAYFDTGEDFALQEELSKRETDILLETSLWFCVLPMPLTAYSAT